LRAPLDGVITSGDVKVGDLLSSGQPVVEIAEQKGFLFEVSVPSEEVGHLQVGMSARIKLDAFDYQKYGTLEGTVRFISPDSGVAEGQRAPSYLVRIELAGEEVGRGDFHGRVKLGMAGQAEIVTGQEALRRLCPAWQPPPAGAGGHGRHRRCWPWLPAVWPHEAKKHFASNASFLRSRSSSHGRPQRRHLSGGCRHP
jgi:multidrug efflux pump subunit AcrA (membrane-fusion protein)